MQTFSAIIESSQGAVPLPIRRGAVLNCAIHGPYNGIQTVLGGQVVCESQCPECALIERKRRQAEREAYEKAKKAAEARDRIEEALRRSCIPAEYRTKTFSNFLAETKNQQGALDLACRFVRGWEKAKETGYGLFFFGNPGTGKSHLACAILHALLPRSEGIYTRATDIIQYVRSTWGGKSDRTSFDAIRLFSEVSLLVIDEVGVQAGTENEKQILFSIIDSRISENRPTIFLSNLRPADLNNVLGPRLVDRIRGKCVAYQFLGNSMRRPLSADVFGEAA